MSKKEKKIPTQEERDYAEEFYQRALKFLEGEYLNDALNWINKSISIEEDAQVLVDKIIILSKMERYEEALDVLRKVFQLKPEFEPALKHKEFLIIKLGASKVINTLNKKPEKKPKNKEKEIKSPKSLKQKLEMQKNFKKLILSANLIFIISFAIGFWGLYTGVESSMTISKIILSLGSFIVGTLTHIIMTIYIEIRYTELVKDDHRVIANQCCTIIFFIIVVSFTVSMILI